MPVSTDTNFRWPTPANLRPQEPPVMRITSPTASTTNLQAALPRILGCETIRLDADLKPALQDMQSTSGVEWSQWLSQMVNDALRHFLGH